MRKKIVFLLAASMISYNMDILADTAGQGDENSEWTVSTPGEAERDTRTNFEVETDDNLRAVSDEDNTVYNVLFPAHARAYLDPGNLSGRGQIFSGEYEIENYGSTDIAIKIKKIEIDLKSSEESYEISETEITDSQPGLKKINVDMVWKNRNRTEEKVLHINNGFPDEYVIWLRASEYDKNGEFVNLDKESSGYFYFTGTLNPNPNIQWEDGEFTVRFSYEIVNASAQENLQEADAQTTYAANRDTGQTGTGSDASRDAQRD